MKLAKRWIDRVALSFGSMLAACGGGDAPGIATVPAPPVVASPPPSPSPTLPPDPTPTPPVEETCVDWEYLLGGDYQYLNNVWNKGTIADYEQCIMRRVVGGEDQYGWRWRWPDTGGEVKALPQVLYGQSPWRRSSTTQSLPRKVSSITALKVDYELYVAADGDFNVVFILWLTSADPPTPESISHNIKIQVYSTESARSAATDQVDIDGVRFAFSAHPVESSTPQGRMDFIFESLMNQLNTELNLLRFLDFLRQSGHVSADHYLSVVEMGNEVKSGSGEVWLGDYAIHTDSQPESSGSSRLVIPKPDPTPPPLDPTPTPPVQEACGDSDEIRTSGFIYRNNVWNKGRFTDYENCIMRRVVDGKDEYGWRWRWPPSSEDVRAYPKIVYGQTPWDTASTTAQLPRQISAVRQMYVDYEAYMTAEGTFNLAFSMWTTDENPPDPDGVMHEIMIWVDWQGFYPDGEHNHVADGEIDGSGFSLYVRQNDNARHIHPSFLGQRYLGFAMHEDQFSGTLDLGAFLEYLVEHGHVPADHYVNNVELGNEAVNGVGELWLKTFRVSVR